MCEWHLRKIFNEERLAQKLDEGKLYVARNYVRERRNPSKQAPSLQDAPYSEEVILADSESNQEVARCQRFLEPDRKTVAASGKLDPKQLYLNGKDYHQLGKKNPVCPHCEAGISTWPEAEEPTDESS